MSLQRPRDRCSPLATTAPSILGCVAQPGRAPPCHGEGCEFKSRHGRKECLSTKCGEVAVLAEMDTKGGRDPDIPHGGCSSAGRAPGCDPGGRGFEPRRSPLSGVDRDMCQSSTGGLIQWPQVGPSSRPQWRVMWRSACLADNEVVTVQLRARLREQATCLLKWSPAGRVLRGRIRCRSVRRVGSGADTSDPASSCSSVAERVHDTDEVRGSFPFTSTGVPGTAMGADPCHTPS